MSISQLDNAFTTQTNAPTYRTHTIKWLHAEILLQVLQYEELDCCHIHQTEPSFRSIYLFTYVHSFPLQSTEHSWDSDIHG